MMATAIDTFQDTDSEVTSSAKLTKDVIATAAIAKPDTSKGPG